MKALSHATLSDALLELIGEAYVGPSDTGNTWFTDNQPDAGLLGSLSTVTAAQAGVQPFPGGDSIAANCNHVRYYLSLANRSFSGENAFSAADWSSSWAVQQVTETQWRELREALAAELETTNRILKSGIDWDQPMYLKGCLGLLAHGAWHLGAVRQLIGVIAAAPSSPHRA